MKTETEFRLPLMAVAVLAVAVLAAAGCQEPADSSGDSAPISELPPGTLDDHDGHDDHGHAHPSEGPHHGDLVELGNEEYHGEVVHDEQTGGIRIYILDGSAAKQVAIEAPELIINVVHEGKPKQFTLTAAPDEGDEAARSSRFVSNDKELAAHLDDKWARPRLVVTINGKSYRGLIQHDHDHDHEAHDHGEHEGHDDHDDGSSSGT